MEAVLVTVATAVVPSANMVLAYRFLLAPMQFPILGIIQICGSMFFA